MTVGDGCQCCYCKHLRERAACRHIHEAREAQQQAASVSHNTRRAIEGCRHHITTSYWTRHAIMREQQRAAWLYKRARRERDAYLALEAL